MCFSNFLFKKTKKEMQKVFENGHLFLSIFEKYEKEFKKKHDFSISLHNAQNTKKMIQNATAYFFCDFFGDFFCQDLVY